MALEGAEASNSHVLKRAGGRDVAGRVAVDQYEVGAAAWLDYRHAQAFIHRSRNVSEESLVLFHAWADIAPIRWNLLGGAFPYRLVVPQSDTEGLLLGMPESVPEMVTGGHLDHLRPPGRLTLPARPGTVI
ncbi:MAG: hypothetical protein ACR2P2_19670 [Nakamurella sp.]